MWLPELILRNHLTYPSPGPPATASSLEIFKSSEKASKSLKQLKPVSKTIPVHDEQNGKSNFNFTEKLQC